MSVKGAVSPKATSDDSNTSLVENLKRTKRLYDNGTISIWRVLYWFSTIIISAMGILMGLYEYSYGSLKGQAVAYARYWIWFRFFLGAGQLPVHLFRLYPGRVNTTVADTGKVPTGIRPKLFYKAIDVCNVCIALVLIGSAFQIRRLLDLENLDFASEIIHLWGEFASATGWAIVLGVRVLSILAGTTKQWFFMAWSDKVRYPKNR